MSHDETPQLLPKNELKQHIFVSLPVIHSHRCFLAALLISIRKVLISSFFVSILRAQLKSLLYPNTRLVNKLTLLNVFKYTMLLLEYWLSSVSANTFSEISSGLVCELEGRRGYCEGRKLPTGTLC